jgi:hypothetical protein
MNKKWMVYNGTSYKNGWFRGTPILGYIIFWKPPILSQGIKILEAPNEQRLALFASSWGRLEIPPRWDHAKMEKMRRLSGVHEPSWVGLCSYEVDFSVMSLGQSIAHDWCESWFSSQCPACCGRHEAAFWKMPLWRYGSRSVVFWIKKPKKSEPFSPFDTRCAMFMIVCMCSSFAFSEKKLHANPKMFF